MQFLYNNRSLDGEFEDSLNIYFDFYINNEYSLQIITTTEKVSIISEK